MTTLLQAINATESVTENGMPTFTSSMSDVVDLFFNAGASRGKNIIPTFSKAFNTDKVLATRVALWARDVRGGAGERQVFKDILKYMAGKDSEFTRQILTKVPELGRWDDLFVLFGTPLERDALRLIAGALNDGDALCSKWCPRKGPDANKIRAYMQKTPKQYRKMLVEQTNVVETNMCANTWDQIEFSKLPSVAAGRYQQAFTRHDGVRYGEYVESLKKGETTINAGAVYPYDVVKSLNYGNVDVANAQWDALPNYMQDSTANILTVVDTSGSMMCPAGNNKTVQCLDVAVSLGLYISERSNGIFKDVFVTFSESPKLQKVNGSLHDRYLQMKNASWGYNTNFERVFNLILDAGVKHNVPPSEMPTMLLIISDMQFDQCIDKPTHNMMQMIEDKYTNAGYYEIPKIVFWNVRATDTCPTTFTKEGTALVSGFSPSLMKSVLSCTTFNPQQVMLETIMVERYNF